MVWITADRGKNTNVEDMNYSTLFLRFDPMMVAKLRPETDIPGLFLTGQDILSCGFTGALFAGVISAQVQHIYLLIIILEGLYFYYSGCVGKKCDG